jgi:hypothetical protein
MPMKMEPIESSETSASNTQTPGIYPKKVYYIANFLFEIFSCKLGKKCTVQYSYCSLLNSVKVLCCKMPFQFWIQTHEVCSDKLLGTCFCDAY